MPCYQIRTMSVEFHAKHRKLLDDAIDALGWRREVGQTTADVITLWAPQGRIVIDLRKGKAECNAELQPQVNQLKRAYSKQALRKASKRAGWNLKQQTAEKGIIRR